MGLGFRSALSSALLQCPLVAVVRPVVFRSFSYINCGSLVRTRTQAGRLVAGDADSPQAFIVPLHHARKVLGANITARSVKVAESTPTATGKHGDTAEGWSVRRTCSLARSLVFTSPRAVVKSKAYQSIRGPQATRAQHHHSATTTEYETSSLTYCPRKTRN